MAGLSGLIVACGLVTQVDLLAAIVLVESGGNTLALAVNGGVELVRAARDRDDAVAMARWLAAHGYSFDAGLAQVNSANLARFGLDASRVFEPCPNLRAAAAILAECRARAEAGGLAGAAAVAASLSCYNTGHLSRGIRNGYVAAVRAALARTPVREPCTHEARADITPLSFPDVSRQPEAFALAATGAFATSAGPEGTP